MDKDNQVIADAPQGQNNLVPPKSGKKTSAPLKLETTTPQFEGANISKNQVFLSLGNEVVLVASKAKINGRKWEVNVGVCDATIAKTYLKPLSEGRGVNPNLRDKQLELFITSEVNKKLGGITIDLMEFVTLLDGKKVVITRLGGKYQTIEDSSSCPYPLYASLEGTTFRAPNPAQVMPLPPNQATYHTNYVNPGQPPVPTHMRLY